MKHYEFNYNKDFSCIAGNCKHNCCIGWQIDIDKKTFSSYQALKAIDARFNEENFLGQTFRLNELSRCPFLDGDNLCHIIKNYGEKALCKTCKIHPRFKTFFTGITETGLGLYCEQACRIILSSKKKMKLVLIKGDEEKSHLSRFERKVLKFRKKVITILQNRKTSVEYKLFLLNRTCDINLERKTFNEWLKSFCSLEKLIVNDFSFNNIPKAEQFARIESGFELEFEQLLCYLTFRHLSRAIDMLDLRVRLAFVILCFNMINHIFSTNEKKDLDTLIEICRFFSSEIETSDNNIFALLDEIEDLISFI